MTSVLPLMAWQICKLVGDASHQFFGLVQYEDIVNLTAASVYRAFPIVDCELIEVFHMFYYFCSSSPVLLTCDNGSVIFPYLLFCIIFILDYK